MTKNKSKVIINRTSHDAPPYAIEVVTHNYNIGNSSYTIRKHDPHPDGEITLSEKELELIMEHIKKPF